MDASGMINSDTIPSSLVDPMTFVSNYLVTDLTF
jgi:hypothetical protein